MFPNLVELWLDRNFLYSRQYNKPHGLPSTWIKSSSFPSLSKLYLYPGNDYICFVLELGAINGGERRLLCKQLVMRGRVLDGKPRHWSASVVEVKCCYLRQQQQPVGRQGACHARVL